MKRYTFLRVVHSAATLSICIVAVLIGLVADDPHVSVGVTAAISPAVTLEKIAPEALQDTANGKSASVIILMSEQADLSAAYAIEDQDARGLYVYDTLRELAARSQAKLRATFDARGTSYKSLWAANAIVVTGNRSLIEMIAARDDVRAIESNRSFKGLQGSPLIDLSTVDPPRVGSPASPDTIEWGVQNVNAPQVWSMGYMGQGIVIGSQDTGMRWTHNALKPHYRGWNGTAANHNYNWWDAIHSGGGICGPDSQVPCDDNGHGTHTTGITTGDDGTGNQIGVAPGAKWIGCRNMDQGSGTPATYTECFQFFIAPTDLQGQNPDPALRPHIINNSWDCPPSEGCAPQTLQQIVENAQAAGIFVEAAVKAGGPACSTVENPPAIYDASFSTGAYDINNALASFSGRGPVTVDGSNRLKPNIVGPGVTIRSAINSSDSSYAIYSGTSSAGPHVVGAVALLWSARPELTRQITETRNILQMSANPNVIVNAAPPYCGNTPPGQIPNNYFGYGRVDALAAVNLVPQQTPTPTNTPMRTPTSQPTMPPCVTITDAITMDDPVQNGMVTRDLTPGQCEWFPPCPGVADSLPRHYKAYAYYFPYSSFSTQCVTVNITSDCPNNLYSVAYWDAFNPANVCAGYVNDRGEVIPSSGAYTFIAFRGHTFIVVVHEMTPNSGCSSYTMTLTSSLGCNNITTHTPTPTPTGTRLTATPTLISSATATVVPPSHTPVPPSTTATIPISTATPTTTPLSCLAQFTDVPQNHTFYAPIRCLACRNIVTGYADGTFRPNNLVTRGQLAKIVSNAAGFTEDPGSQVFQDVPSNNPFYEWINRLTNRGYMTGYVCGGPGEPCTTGKPYFRPFANATRGQTSKIVSNAAGFTQTPSGQTFEDVPSTHTFYEFIQRLADRGVMGGYTCGGPGEPCLSGKPYFRPGNDVTRGQSAKIVANTFFPGCNP